jgi:HlyD family secretion protein
MSPKRLLLALILVLAAGLAVVFGWRLRRVPERAASAVVARGELALWTPCEGALETRRMDSILSRLSGRATLLQLVPEGSLVKAGDVLARFDCSDIEREAVKVRQDLARAEAELDALENAELPLERQELDLKIQDLKAQVEADRQTLADTRELVARKLVPRTELDQQDSRLAASGARLRQLEQRAELMQRHLHPSRIAAARANVAAARRQEETIARQLADSVIPAPAAGLVTYLPVHLGNEFRAVRVGDTLYANQPFMCIPDMSELVVHCYLPESELGLAQPGARAVVTPVAYPDCRLRAVVETVGAMAQSQPNQPAWRKYFRVTVRIEDRDPRLRPGMSLLVDILSYRAPDALLVPRLAVTWEQGEPACQVLTRQGQVTRRVRLGRGNERWFEVLEGLEPGNQVVLP